MYKASTKSGNKDRKNRIKVLASKLPNIAYPHSRSCRKLSLLLPTTVAHFIEMATVHSNIHVVLHTPFSKTCPHNIIHT